MVPEKYVRLIQEMYRNVFTRVRSSVGETEGFEVRVGLHQGSALSPFIFNIVMDVIIEEVRRQYRGTYCMRMILSCVQQRAGRSGNETGKMETTSLRKTEEKKMDVAEMRMLRWMAGVTREDRIRNDYIRGSTKVVEISKKVQEEAEMVWTPVEKR
ncbi:uncharacterized protein [Macrobrachium rosenbergii]|uniref:uncharacterized protein n=1 Tax=Macrobrachium rosenbergii TaxID=79674 RepID=UPI0034D73173